MERGSKRERERVRVRERERERGRGKSEETYVVLRMLYAVCACHVVCYVLW